MMATVALQHGRDGWAMRAASTFGPYSSADPDTARIWWSDTGVHQNLTFPVHPDPISGMHCWHQAVRVRPAEPGDAHGDIAVDTARARAGLPPLDGADPARRARVARRHPPAPLADAPAQARPRRPSRCRHSPTRPGPMSDGGHGNCSAPSARSPTARPRPGPWRTRSGWSRSSDAEHTEVFVLNCPPYASVYLGPDGALGGEGADRAAGFWRASGHHAARRARSPHRPAGPVRQPGRGRGASRAAPGDGAGPRPGRG